MRTHPKVRAEDASLVAKLADLLERAGPQFIAAARRHVAATQVEAAAPGSAARPGALDPYQDSRKCGREDSFRRRSTFCGLT